MMRHTAPSLLRKHLSRTLATSAVNSGEVVLVWDAAPADPNMQTGDTGGKLMTQPVKALVHYVSAQAVLRAGVEYSAGDAILDFSGTTDLRLSDRSGMRFRLPDGKIYGAKSTGRQPVLLREVAFGGSVLVNSVVVQMRPDGAPAATIGEVKYVTGAENRTLYRTDADGLWCCEPSLAKTRAWFDWSVPGEMRIRFGSAGTVALHADGSRVAVKSLTNTLSSTLPRLEFWYAGVKRATLTAAGQLAATAFADEDPGEAALRVQNGLDLFAIASGGLWAPAFTDEL